MNDFPLDGTAQGRRNLLKSGALAAPATLALGPLAHIEGRAPLKVGLVGCGGRGTGAAAQAIRANSENILWAMADAFKDRIDRSHSNLVGAAAGMREGRGKEQLQVADERRFVGLDAFDKLLASGVDVVLLATPPYFRPAQIEAAVKAGVHIFTEKPMAVDGVGVQRVLDAARLAKEKSLSIVAGFCWRFKENDRQFIDAIREGKMGDVRAVYTDYMGGVLRTAPREENWTDFEFQMRNWQHFNWLGGDHITEQAVHSVDKLNWIMGDRKPARAVALGGRQARPDVPETGNIFDHFGVLFEYDNGARGFHLARQTNSCFGRNSDYVLGTKGTADCNSWGPKHQIVDHDGKKIWKGNRRHLNDMYQQEHDELFAAIRGGEPINDGEWMAQSTLMAVMARESAYTGQAVSYEQALATKAVGAPEKIAWDAKVPDVSVPVPGRRK